MEEIAQAIGTIVKKLFGVTAEIVLTRPEEQFGDFATNIALQLAQKLGRKPREVAEEIATELKHESITKTEVAGPGFINITLSPEALLTLVSAQPPQIMHGKTVVIETNNPNPFKAMHIGHAFNAILGDSIANLIEMGGASTYRVSYHGDVGLHVGKSMYSLLRFVKGDAGKLHAVKPEERNSFMSKMYAEGSAAYKDDENVHKEIDELAKQSFTREDKVYAEVYELCKNWSFEQIDSIVARLGNKPVIEKFLESDAELRGIKIVKDNVPEVFQESDGALVFKGSNYGSFDNAFVSSKGTGLYAARDLGLMQLKNEQYHPDQSYIVTAEEQRAYFVGVIAAAEQALPELKGVTVNISTGTVKLTTGKMSSRDGDVIEISWLFDQIGEAIKARGGEPDDPIIAGALRYQFLHVRIGGDVVFDVGDAVSLQGNSGPYLQYAHARARSILRKSGKEAQSLGLGVKFELGERTLVRKLGMYAETVRQATEELMPHIVCTYLYELAQEFNRFYEGNQVIGDIRETLRLSLVSRYADTLKEGLSLLGIHAPDSM
ncbi:arginine--tRNA ligase [soil metagenome]